MDGQSSLTPSLSHPMGEGAQGAGEGSWSCLPWSAREASQRRRSHGGAGTGRKARPCPGHSFLVPLRAPSSRAFAAPKRLRPRGQGEEVTHSSLREAHPPFASPRQHSLAPRGTSGERVRERMLRIGTSRMEPLNQEGTRLRLRLRLGVGAEIRFCLLPSPFCLWGSWGGAPGPVPWTGFEAT